MSKIILIFVTLAFLCVPALAAEQKDLVVVAAGLGRSLDSAEENARSNALRSALGAMLAPDTLVEHEQALRPGILSDTAPYIAGFQLAGEPAFVDGGLALVTARVAVRVEPLERALKNQGLAVASLDGESLTARQWTQRESREDAGKIMAELLRQMPAGVVRASAEASQAAHRLEGDKMRIELPVLVQVNPESYKLWLENIRATLVKLGANPRVEEFPGPADYPLAAFKKSVGLPEKVEDDDRFGLLAMCELVAEKRSRWMLAAVPLSAINAFDRGTSLRVTVDLLDATGQVVTSQDFNIGQGRDGAGNIFAGSSFHKSVCIAPSIDAMRIDGGICATRGAEGAVLRKTVSFTLSMDELRKISQVRCVVGNL